MASLKFKWGKEDYTVNIEEGSSVEQFKLQVWSLTNVPADRQKWIFPGGMLKDDDDLCKRVSSMKAGAMVKLMGTAEEGQLKAPVEKVVFEEDLTPEEKAKILKARKVEVPPAGIKNLGNTCYMNSVLQCMNAVTSLKENVSAYNPPVDPAERDIDATLTAQFKQVTRDLTNTTDCIMPLQFVMALRQRFPRFAEMQNGSYMQQDADECLRGLFTVMANTLPSASPNGNKIDDLFGYELQSTLKCLECDEEPPTTSQEINRVLICHLGTQTEPVSHILQGVQLSMKEHIEKNSPFLGRNAQYEKTSSMNSMPPYLVVQYARFGFKGANEWAGTQAAKVKLTKKCAFSQQFDLFDCASDTLKKTLRAGRIKQKELEDAKLERERKAMGIGVSESDKKDVEMKEADGDVDMKPMEEYETGYYDLIGIVSHKGRTADGGHYVAWTLKEKADGKELKDDRWVCYDDETTTFHNYKDIVGLSTDLQGGKPDTQIAYLAFYKKVTVKDEGNVLGTADASASSS